MPRSARPSGLAPASSTDLGTTERRAVCAGSAWPAAYFQRIGDRRAADRVSIDAPRQVFSFEGILNRPAQFRALSVQAVRTNPLRSRNAPRSAHWKAPFHRAPAQRTVGLDLTPITRRVTRFYPARIMSSGHRCVRKLHCGTILTARCLQISVLGDRATGCASVASDLDKRRTHERNNRAHAASVQDLSSEHTHTPSANFITHVGISSAAPRTRAPQPIHAFISPLTKASRSAFTFSGSVIAIP